MNNIGLYSLLGIPYLFELNDEMMRSLLWLLPRSVGALLALSGSPPANAHPPPLRSLPPSMRQKWVLGVNQYSHDAGAALLSVDGKESIIVPKERVTRNKCDGGDTAAAVEHALNAVGATMDDILVVCANNHHFRIAPFEKRLHWSTELGIYPESSTSEYNMLPGIPKYEISHHLAHAWSVLAQASFPDAAPSSPNRKRPTLFRVCSSCHA